MKIKGVTFKNSDGEKRQEIIKSLYCSLGEYITLKLVRDKIEVDGKLEDCIKVYEKTTRKQLGFVPKAMLDEWLPKCRQTVVMTGRILKAGKYDRLGVDISEPQTPSSANYWAMKQACSSVGVAMPVYDERAYRVYWAALRTQYNINTNTDE